MIEILADANATLLAEGNATQAVEQAKGITGSIQAGLGCLGAAIAVAAPSKVGEGGDQNVVSDDVDHASMKWGRVAIRMWHLMPGHYKLRLRFCTVSKTRYEF